MDHEHQQLGAIAAQSRVQDLQSFLESYRQDSFFLKGLGCGLGLGVLVGLGFELRPFGGGLMVRF